MLKWKGSVFRLLWHNLLIFLVIYFTLAVIYRFWIFDNEALRESFELLCIYSSR